MVDHPQEHRFINYILNVITHAKVSIKWSEAWYYSDQNYKSSEWLWANLQTQMASGKLSGSIKFWG